MSKEEENKNKVNEPGAGYRKQEIVFFNSFQEMNDRHAMQMASLTPEERLNELERMRKMFLAEYLLPDGSWPLDKTIRIRKPFLE